MSRFVDFASWRRGWRPFAVVLLLCVVTGLAQAQVADVDADDVADPPSRVARLSYMAGDLGFLPSGAEDWDDASVNRPLTTGDRLSSGQNARAELEFGGGTLHVDGGTDLGLLDLDDELAQIELTRGTLRLTVRSLDEGQSYEIDTPVVALVIDRPGRFRVDVGDSDVRVTAFAGAAAVYGENDAQRTINPGRSYRFVDSGLNEVTITDVGGDDAFDHWATGRDQRYAQSGSSQYVSEEVVGYQDLDQYGSWQETSEYGAMWFPAGVATDWAPYRNGHWAYIAPWGWTWVDDSPWGFAPYHYGRWAHVRGSWGWIPGPRGVRPVYAPALVAFVGGGSWSVGIGGAPVGWFPLGPGDIYNPWYRCGRSYYTRVNLRNLRPHRGYDHHRDIAGHYERYRHGRSWRGDRYMKRGTLRGFTAVSGEVFAGGRHVRRHLVRVDPRKLGDAPVLSRDAGKWRPVRDGSRLSRNAHVRSLPAGGFKRGVVARHAPPVRALGPHASIRGNARAGLKPGTGTASQRVRLLNSSASRVRSVSAITSDEGSRRTSNPRHGNAAAVRQLPRVPRIRAAATADRPSVHRADAGALRSARFARSGNHDRAAAPKPVAGSVGRRADGRPASATLPRVSRIQRATPTPVSERPTVRRNRPARPAERVASPRPRVAGRSAGMTRGRPAPSAIRSRASESLRSAPRAVQRRAPVSRPTSQPRFRQPQRAAPAVRAAQPRSGVRAAPVVKSSSKSSRSSSSSSRGKGGHRGH